MNGEDMIVTYADRCCTAETAEATTRFLISISDPAGNPVIGQSRVVKLGGGKSPQIQGLWHLRLPRRCEQEDPSRTTKSPALSDLWLPSPALEKGAPSAGHSPDSIAFH